MRKDLYEEMYLLEEVYWWHVAKRRLVKRLLEGKVGKYGDKVYVDVGCGTGKMMEEMSKWKKWKKSIGLDGSEEALKFCRKRGVGSVRMADFEKKLPLLDNSVDVISSLDVVEHIEDDQGLLMEFERVLKPGGVVVITVPAYKWLWTYWDDMLAHKRRYTVNEVEDKFNKAGLLVSRVSYFYSYLLPVALIFRLLKSVMKKDKESSDFVTIPRWANNLLLKLSEWETRVIEKMKIPIGLSVVCVARKPEMG